VTENILSSLDRVVALCVKYWGQISAGSFVVWLFGSKQSRMLVIGTVAFIAGMWAAMIVALMTWDRQNFLVTVRSLGNSYNGFIQQQFLKREVFAR